MNMDFFKDMDDDRDNLTFLYRRNVINDYMEHLITENVPFAFVMLDIDNFKLVNDTYGHLTGDEVLREVASSLNKQMTGRGVVGRYGGDEFVFIIPNVTEYQDIWQISYNLLKSAADVKVKDIVLSYTMGIARFPIDSTSIEELITLADKALYRGKIKGRNCFIIYLAEKHANISLQTTREKVYSPMSLHARIHTMLTMNNNIMDNIKKVINFIGPYLMIDHLCIESGNKLLFEYNHPIAPDKQFRPYTEKKIESKIANFGTFIENTVESSKSRGDKGLIDEMHNQGVFASVICKISSFGIDYGYLRAEMTGVDTGRIWQNDDLVLLEDLACKIALILYAKGEKF